MTACPKCGHVDASPECDATVSDVAGAFPYEARCSCDCRYEIEHAARVQSDNDLACVRFCAKWGHPPEKATPEGGCTKCGTDKIESDEHTARVAAEEIAATGDYQHEWLIACAECDEALDALAGMVQHHAYGGPDEFSPDRHCQHIAMTLLTRHGRMRETEPGRFCFVGEEE